MKSLFLLLLCFVHPPVHKEEPSFIDPTGTYILRGDIKKNNIVGHYGEMRVRLLDRRTAAFCFYINNGYPNFDSGAALDTLIYDDNRLQFRPSMDSGCFLVLTFSLKSVEIMEVYGNPRSGCGFAPGVMDAATFRKISSEIPVIQDLSGRGQPGG
jgi:hypothetical protein